MLSILGCSVPGTRPVLFLFETGDFMTFGEYASREWTKLKAQTEGSQNQYPAWLYCKTQKEKYDEWIFRMTYQFIPFMNEQLGWSFSALVHHYGSKQAFSMLDWPKYEMDGKYGIILKSLSTCEQEERESNIITERLFYIKRFIKRPWFDCSSKTLHIPSYLIEAVTEEI